MKILLHAVSLLLLLLAMSSCSEEQKRMSFKTGVQSDFVEKTSTVFSVDTADRTLIITIEIKNGAAINFPVDKENGDTLTFAALRFNVRQNGRVLSCEDGKCNFITAGYNRFGDNNGETLSFTADTLDLASRRHIQFRLPFYFLRDVKAGTNAIEVEILGGDYYSRPVRIQKDSLTIARRKSMRGDELKALLSFNLNIPKIYSSQFICKKITLQNDSAWNPYSSDFTLFRSPLPDIYYEVFYPAEFSFYQSPYQKSSVEFNESDTCAFYFYSETDSLSFGIYDHDNFSKDDVLGFIRCSVSDLIGKRVQKRNHINAFEAELTAIKPDN